MIIFIYTYTIILTYGSLFLYLTRPTYDDFIKDISNKPYCISRTFDTKVVKCYKVKEVICKDIDMGMGYITKCEDAR